MKKKLGKNSLGGSNSSQLDVSASYVENRIALQKYLSRFFANRQDVEDAAQEAYLRVYEAEEKKEIKQPKAYMYRAAKNVALSKLRLKSGQIIDYIEDCSTEALVEAAASSENPENQLEAEQKLKIIIESIETLPSKCREAVWLRKAKGLSHKEIANNMSLSISSVEKYLRQGFLEIQECIDKSERPISEGEQLRRRWDDKNTEYWARPK